MADITMCFGETCPLKSSCYRFLAESDGDDQTYFGAPPFSEEDGVVACKFYWEINPSEKSND